MLSLLCSQPLVLPHFSAPPSWTRSKPHSDRRSSVVFQGFWWGLSRWAAPGPWSNPRFDLPLAAAEFCLGQGGCWSCRLWQWDSKWCYHPPFPGAHRSWGNWDLNSQLFPLSSIWFTCSPHILKFSSIFLSPLAHSSDLPLLILQNSAQTSGPSSHRKASLGAFSLKEPGTSNNYNKYQFSVSPGCGFLKEGVVSSFPLLPPAS